MLLPWSTYPQTVWIPTRKPITITWQQNSQSGVRLYQCHVSVHSACTCAKNYKSISLVPFWLNLFFLSFFFVIPFLYCLPFFPLVPFWLNLFFFFSPFFILPFFFPLVPFLIHSYLLYCPLFILFFFSFFSHPFWFYIFLLSPYTSLFFFFFFFFSHILFWYWGKSPCHNN